MKHLKSFDRCWGIISLLGALLLAGTRAQAQYPWNDFPGNPPITARWAFEPWVWDGNNETAKGATNMVDGYLSNSIPVGAVIVDSPWFTAYNDFQWDLSSYPSPTNMVRTFMSQGVRTICWCVGVVDKTTSGSPPPDGEDPGYNTVVADGYSIDGTTNFSTWFGSGLGIDFSNPNASSWFMARAANLIAMGVSGLKVDQADVYAPDPVWTSSGSTFGRESMPRGQYSEYYYAEMTKWIQGMTNVGITFSRPYSGERTTGSNQGYETPPSELTAGWCGDFGGDFPGYIEQLGQVYTSINSGYSAVGFEVGGYQGGSPTHDSLLRQAELAALLPIMEDGGSNGGETLHVPWYWDTQGYTDTVSTYRYYATLHHNLAPFEFHLSVNANLTGQPACGSVDTTTDRHVLGNAILTFAITSAGTVNNTMDFPAGSLWVSWWTGHTFNGGTTLGGTYPVDEAPIFVRAGSIIPLNVDTAVTGLGDTNSKGKVTVLMYPDQMNQLVYHRPLGDGTTYENDALSVAEGTNGYVEVSAPTSQSWIFKVKCLTNPLSVTGADSWSYNASSNMLTISKTGAAFTISVSPLLGYGSLDTNTLNSGTYKIINLNSGLAVDAKGGNTTNGTPIEQYAYHSGSNEMWNLTSLGDGQYTITGVQSGRVLDVKGQSTANGATIQLYDSNGGSNQMWTITPTTNGYSTVQGVQSGKLMEVIGSATTNGAFLDIWSSTGGANQQWSFQSP